MSDTPPTPADKKAPVTLSELRELRDYFSAEANRANDKVALFDKKIADVEQAEAETTRQDALATYLPGLDAPSTDKSAFNGHDFVFLANNTKDAGHGPESLLGASVAASHKLHTILNAAGGTDATVSQRFWGSKNGVGKMNLDSRFGATAYNTENIVQHNMLLAANAILRDSTPDKTTGRATHYIILGDGDISGDTKDVADVLEAAAKLDPKATFDFIVVSNNSITAGERLAYELHERGVKGGKMLPVKIFGPSQIDAAVVNLVKKCLDPEVPAAPIQKKKPRKSRAKKAAPKS